MSGQIGYRDELLGTSWLGEVVDVDDPLKRGRVRVRVYGKFDQLEVGDIPWAAPSTIFTAGSSSGGGFLSVPKKGSVVAVTFSNGDLYFPEYRFNQELSKEAREEVSDSYKNAHVILYDTETSGAVKIFFTEKKGLVLDYKGVVVNLKPDKSLKVSNPHGDVIEMTNSGNVNVKCTKMRVEASGSIHLDCSKNSSVKLGKNAAASVILGEQFLAVFNSHTHTGNMGAPTSPPTSPAPNSVLSKVTKTQ